jgi:hypothetical protein
VLTGAGKGIDVHVMERLGLSANDRGVGAGVLLNDLDFQLGPITDLVEFEFPFHGCAFCHYRRKFAKLFGCTTENSSITL